MRRHVRTELLVLALATAATAAADWPQYRHDAARSAHTNEALPGDLSLRWTYRPAHRPMPAWPDRQWQKMTFDFCCQPVVAGGMLYYGSSADCHVHALDAGTGKGRWSFCTDGPVRFAPAAWRDRLFVASDDGYLYCLRAADGRLLWKLRGGPSGGKILGNGRMISMFPARGGPVVHGSTVVFGAGVFPTQGFFLHAIDAASGRVVWRNDTSGNTRLYQYNHGFTYGNVAAQGYLAAVGGGATVLVPTGRGIPAAFSFRDGGLLHHNPLEVYRTGGSWLMADADGKHFYNDDMAFHVKTGAVACPELGTAPARGAPSSRSPMLRTVRMVSGAIIEDSILIANGTELRALDRAQPFVDSPEITRKWASSRTAAFFAGSPRRRLSQNLQGANVRWEVPLPCRGELIVAGKRAYSGADGAVHALDLETRKIVWTAKIEGTAHGLAAADGRLYASTDTGAIYCFGAGRGAGRIVEAKPQDTPYGDNAIHARAAEEILRRTGVTEGYCLDLACGDGRLAWELARRTKLHVIACDADASSVAAARGKLTAAGLYGPRVTVHRLDAAATGYPAYFANLIVSGRSVAEGAGVVPWAEAKRLQRPCGGAICVGRPGAMRVAVRGRLEGAGVWTHQSGTAANTCASTDRLAGGPLGVLWFGTSGPAGMVPSKARPAAPLYVDGRLYIAGQRFLRCLDAYNGRVAWEKPLPHRASRECYMGANLLGSHYCAGEKEVFFVDDRRGVCLRLDGATGKELGRLRPPARPDGRPGRWAYIAHEDGLLYGTLEGPPMDVGFSHYLAALGTKEEISRGRFTEGCLLFAMDAATGEVKWQHRPKDLIPVNGIAIGGGRVYLIDRPDVSARIARLRRRGQGTPAAAGVGALVALDAAGGKVLWRNDEDVFGTLLALSVEHDALVMGLPIMRRGNLLCDLFTKLAAHRSSDGKRLWSRRIQYHQRPLVVGRTVIVDPGGFDWKTGRKQVVADAPCAFDLLTGEPKMRANPVTGQTEPWTFGRSEKCSAWTASERLILYRTGTISYYDVVRDEGVSDVGGVRPGCMINVFAAGGLVFAPDNFAGCTCNYLHRTSMALQQLEAREHWALFMGREPRAGFVRHLALNVGAIGDRRDARGVLWLALPRPDMQKRNGIKVDARALALDGRAVRIDFPGHTRPDPRRQPPKSWPNSRSETWRPGSLYHVNADTHPVAGTDVPWVYTSGQRGPLRVAIDVSRMPAATKYRVRLHFAELAPVKPHERVFGVDVAGKAFLRRFDIAAEAKTPAAALVKETTVGASGSLEISLVPKRGRPVLSGVEIIALPPGTSP